MNKKGSFGAILFFFILIAIVLSAGLFLAIGGAVMDMFFDEFVPEIENIGTVGSSNITEYSEYGLTPVNTFVQSFTWLGGVIYMLAIILVFGMAIAARATANRWLIGFFMVTGFLLIIGSIFISNIYQDFYQDDGDLGTRLQNQEILSFLILHSPVIFSIVIFVSGIIVFSGLGEESYV